jgi:starch synthase
LGSLLELCQAPVQVIVAGRGELGTEFAAPRFKRLVNYRYLERDEGELTRRLLSAADFRLCPNREDLLGTEIHAAHRYGVIPVALGTPLALDAIVDCASDLSSGTGFLFDEASSEAAFGCAERAISSFRLDGFPKLRRRVMGVDVGWERAARRFAQLYKMVGATSHPLDG